MNTGRLFRHVWQFFPVPLRPRLMTWLLSPFAPKGRNLTPPPQAPVYVIGYFHAATGLGQSARLYWRELRQAGIEAYAVDVTQVLFQQPTPEIFFGPCLSVNDAAHRQGAGTVVFHINPAIILYALIVLRRLCAGKRLIGYWAWELEDIPIHWRNCLRHVDAVEVPSRFIANAVSRHTNKPVDVHHHAVPQIAPSERRFAEDGITRVLFIFDAASNFYRKNPLSAVRAFQRAFGDDPAYELVLKAGTLSRAPDGEKALLRLIGQQQNIRLLQGRLSARELDSLYRNSDIYLSLHRSEGYGLSIHEAMQYGLHIVATDWSGNTDFMRGPTVRPVPYRLVPVADPQGQYCFPTQRWAEADVQQAALLLRKIVEENRPGTSLPAVSGRFAPLCADAVAVILVNYRTPEMTLNCLEKVEHLTLPPRRIIVVDNGSEDGSPEMLAEGWSTILPSGGTVVSLEPGEDSEAARIIVRLPDNRGFSAGNNAALRLLQKDETCRAFWLLNTDTLPEPDALNALCAQLETAPEAGACGSTIIRAASGRVQCAAGASLNKWTGETRFLCDGKTKNDVTAMQPEYLGDTLDEITGASLLIRRETLADVGLMPEEYFLYHEDMDWSLRMQKQSWRLAWAPDSVVQHREGGSTGVGRVVPPLMDYLLLRNRAYLMKQFYPSRLPAVLARYALIVAKRCALGRFKASGVVIKATLDAFRERMGKPDVKT